jgi:hypothetical protein
MTLERGMWLYASCSAEWFGPITRVYKDDNGRDLLDFELDAEQVNEFMDTGDNDVDIGFDKYGNARATFALGARATMTHVRYRPSGHEYPDLFVLNTPGNGCYRCTKLFSVHNERGA